MDPYIQFYGVEEANDFRSLNQLKVLKLCSCMSLMTLVGIAITSTLHKVVASNCRELKELQNNFSTLKQFKVIFTL